MPKLQITHDPTFLRENNDLFTSQVESIDLENFSKLAIGRFDIQAETQCDILLDYKHVSRRHCTLVLMVKDKSFFWTVRDGVYRLKRFIPSANGTFVNGNLITKITTLNDGDLLTFSPNHYYPNIKFLADIETDNIRECDKDTIGYEYEE